MVHKFYRHVIQQHRSWIAESIDVSQYGDYQYPDSMLSEEEQITDAPDVKLLTSLPARTTSYYGPYTQTNRA